MNEKGLVHIYCGDGKGKTTAAVGLAIRCVGGGGRALFYQFLKDGSSGEIQVIKNLAGVDYISGYKIPCFSFKMTDEQKAEAKQGYIRDFDLIADMVSKNQYDILVLDEVLHAVNLGYIDIDKLVSFIKSKPYYLELVLTGRNPHRSLIELADYVSEIKKHKHPYDRGVGARKYIEM